MFRPELKSLKSLFTSIYHWKSVECFVVGGGNNFTPSSLRTKITENLYLTPYTIGSLLNALLWEVETISLLPHCFNRRTNITQRAEE